MPSIFVMIVVRMRPVSPAIWRLLPRARNPDIPSAPRAPVAFNPNIAVARHRWPRLVADRGRRCANRNCDLPKCRHRNRRSQNTAKQPFCFQSISLHFGATPCYDADPSATTVFKYPHFFPSTLWINKVEIAAKFSTVENVSSRCPRYPPVSPQTDHKNTTPNTRFFAKTPAKTTLHHAQKNAAKARSSHGIFLRFYDFINFPRNSCAIPPIELCSAA
jgi:hypothetical protein